MERIQPYCTVYSPEGTLQILCWQNTFETPQTRTIRVGQNIKTTRNKKLDKSVHVLCLNEKINLYLQYNIKPNNCHQCCI